MDGATVIFRLGISRLRVLRFAQIISLVNHPTEKYEDY